MQKNENNSCNSSYGNTDVFDFALVYLCVLRHTRPYVANVSSSSVLTDIENVGEAFGILKLCASVVEL